MRLIFQIYSGPYDLFIFSGLQFQMEFIKRRKSRFSNFSKTTSQPFADLLSHSNTLSLNTSLVEAQKQISDSMMDCNLKKKASFILKQIVCENTKCLEKQKEPRKKISLMSQPRKKFEKKQFFNHFRMKIRGINADAKKSYGFSHSNKKEKSHFKEEDEEERSGLTGSDFDIRDVERQKPFVSKQFLSLQGYFSLVLAKISGSGRSELIKILAEELAEWYQKNPQDIIRDVLEIRKVSKPLLRALANKQNFVELKSYEVMEINGTVPRLIFHLVHIISSRKHKKNSNLLKIYHQIEYCSRSLYFNRVTLKICFTIGNLLKETHQEQQAKIYYDKAMKLSIFLNDKFHEEKAIDLMGMSSFVESKTSSAAFYHSNFDKLNPFERNMIKEKYSPRQQIFKLGKVRDFERCHSKSKKQLNIGEEKLETYAFTGPEQEKQYEWTNKKDFKIKMSSYIRIPSMRKYTLKARQSLEKIEKIGSVKRLKRFETVRANLICKVKEEIQNSNQVLLSHRSLNRLKPDVEVREIETERKMLLELLSYYTNDHLFNFPEMSECNPHITGSTESPIIQGCLVE